MQVLNSPRVHKMVITVKYEIAHKRDQLALGTPLMSEAVGIAATVVMRTSHGLVTGFSGCADGLPLNHCLSSSDFRSSYVVPVQVQGPGIRAWHGAYTGIKFRMVSARLFWNWSLSLIWF